MRYALTILALLGLAAPDSQAGGRLFRGRCRPCVPAACRVIPHSYYAPHAAPSTNYGVFYLSPEKVNSPAPCCPPGKQCGPERIPAPQACPGGKCPAVVPFVGLFGGCANGRCCGR
jgi:hypothetical protein